MLRFSFVFTIFLLLSGCALNVSLLPEPKPLEEKVLEGEGKAKILVLDLDGTISFKEETGPLNLKTGPSKVAFFREALKKAEEDPDIAGVVIRINSPGGSVSASDTLYHELVTFRKKKHVPLHAYILEVGASGGYYVAAASDRIIAGPTAITGSIGVIIMKFSLEGLLAKIGVEGETFKSGPKKDFWSPLRPTTSEEKEMLQAIIDNLYSRFLEVVAENRKARLTPAEIRSLADGRILTAADALKTGLIDEIAYLDESIEHMKKGLGLSQAKVVTYARPKTYRSGIYSETEPPGPQVINLISLNAEDLSLFSGVQFLYLWNP